MKPMRALKYPLTFLATLCVLFAFLFAAANVPYDAVRAHFEESAEYMAAKDTATLVHSFALSSRLDYYADSVTLSIAYYLHGDNPLESCMWASYYGENSNVMNQYFLESVRTGAAPNHEYLRYWHGSAAAMRLLHTVTSVRTVYALHALLMAALLVALVWRLWRCGLRGEAAAFVIAMVASAIWLVPWCLEYTYAFLCMLVAAIVGVELAARKKNSWMGPFFLATGMATVFFDFLTTELLSLLVPLLLVLRVQRHEETAREQWLDALKCGVAWVVGYVGMWAMKWFLASVILHIDVMPYVLGHIAERLDGHVVGYYITGNFYLDTLVKNLRCIFPLEYGISGAALVLAAVVGLFVLPIAMGRIRLRNGFDGGRMLLYAVLGLVPYVRYLVLHNHSYVHSFFTYRMQAATVMAACFIALELLERVPRKAAVRKTEAQAHAFT